MNRLVGTARTLAGIANLVTCLIAWWAVLSLASDVWGWNPWLAALFGAAVMLLISPLMTPLGIWGAVTAWGWPWYLAVLVLLWPLVLSLATGAGFGILSLILARRERPTAR